MTKTQAISAMILAKVAEGMSVREAIDAVIGAGTSEKFVGDLYEQLRGRA